MSKELSKSVDILVKNLEDDPGYYYSWQANIAAMFQAEWRKVSDNQHLFYPDDKIHLISNNAAKNFLNLLIRFHKP